MNTLSYFILKLSSSRGSSSAQLNLTLTAQVFSDIPSIIISWYFVNWRKWEALLRFQSFHFLHIKIKSTSKCFGLLKKLEKSLAGSFGRLILRLFPIDLKIIESIYFDVPPLTTSWLDERGLHITWSEVKSWRSGISDGLPCRDVFEGARWPSHAR